jgi:hypothetical protein
LYAIARGLNPTLSLDIGTRWGASAAQMATKVDHVISVDVETHMYGSKQPVGKFIPDDFEVGLVTSDAMLYLKMDTNMYGLIYEDTDHTFESTEEIYKLAIDRLMAGGVIISHDACHPKFKGAVVAGIHACGIEPQVYLVEGDSCGLSIWQKPRDDNSVVCASCDVELVFGNHQIGDLCGICQANKLKELPIPETQEETVEQESKGEDLTIPPPIPPKPKKRKSTKRKSKSVSIEDV